MPWMPGARCSTPGCTAMADPKGRGHCHRHKPVGWYDRPSVHTQVVDERRMGRIKRRLLRSRPLCELCQERQATEVDHIVPLAGAGRSDQSYPPGWGMGSVYDTDNLQVLCRQCHALKTQAEARELREWRRQARSGRGDSGPRVPPSLA